MSALHTYAAEQQWEFQVAMEAHGGTDLYWSAVRTDMKTKCSDRDHVVSLYSRLAKAFGLPAVSLRYKRAQRSNGSYTTGGKVVLNPDAYLATALHEFAHHLAFSRGHTGHGAGFRKAMADVVADQFGQPAADLLRTCYKNA
jgi:hypothetical protein